MAKNITAPLLAFFSAASINCASSQPVEHPQQPDCSSIDLREKVGFSAEVGSEKGSICYKIQSGYSHFYEYLRFCKPAEGTFEFYRHFAGLNKGGMEMDYISEFMGGLAYIHFSRTSSGEITIPSGAERLIDEVEEKFKAGAELLDSIKNTPKVCKELSEYRKK